MSDNKRLSINLPVELVSKVDTYAKKINLSRTAAITILLTLGLNGSEGAEALKQLNTAYKLDDN